MEPRAWRPDEDPRAKLEAERAHDAAKEKRNGQLWNVVVGIALLFAGGFHPAMAVGGVLMIGYGGTMYLVWSARMARHHDPWDDPEIDAWEEEHFDP